MPNYRNVPCDDTGKEITMPMLKALQAKYPKKLFIKKFVVSKDGIPIKEFDTHSEAEEFIRQEKKKDEQNTSQNRPQRRGKGR
jgi:hypothetical protein